MISLAAGDLSAERVGANRRRPRGPRGTLATVAAWKPADVPDQSGRIALVTGANSGIGFEAARALAARGAHVLLAVRDLARGQAAQTRIASALPHARLEVLQLDLGDLAQVRDAAARVNERHGRLDVLCNNAGVMAIERGLSRDGFELQLAVNHLGHFALTGSLLPSLLASVAGRVVTVTSLVHKVGRIRFDDLDGARSYERWSAYAQSKLANLLFAYELQRRLTRIGVPAISAACHPGYAATNLQLVAPQAEGRKLSASFFRVSNGLFAQSAERGAWPTLFAATAPSVQGGECVGPGGPGGIWGPPKIVETSAASRDEAIAARLWEVSAQRTGVSYDRLIPRSVSGPSPRW
jgi:NAD(P)-dependent dehydrogenase (short-subunit alcohol dehydrogenase family)